jgi:hypothetical protein
MREYRSEQSSSPDLTARAAATDFAAPLGRVVEYDLPPTSAPALSAPAMPQQGREHELLAEALSALDPIRRLAGALQATGPGTEGIIDRAAPIAQPAPPRVPELGQTAMAVIAAPEPQMPLPVRTSATLPQVQRRLAPASGGGTSGWPSFATGFAIALAFSAGLYVYLTG